MGQCRVRICASADFNLCAIRLNIFGDSAESTFINANIFVNYSLDTLCECGISTEKLCQMTKNLVPLYLSVHSNERREEGEKGEGAQPLGET